MNNPVMEAAATKSYEDWKAHVTGSIIRTIGAAFGIGSRKIGIMLAHERDVDFVNDVLNRECESDDIDYNLWSFGGHQPTPTLMISVGRGNPGVMLFIEASPQIGASTIEPSALDLIREGERKIRRALDARDEDSTLDAATRVAVRLEEAHRDLAKRDKVVSAQAATIQTLRSQSSKVWKDGDKFTPPLRACLDMRDGETIWLHTQLDKDGDSEKRCIYISVPKQARLHERLIGSATLYDAEGRMIAISELSGEVLMNHFVVLSGHPALSTRVF